MKREKKSDCLVIKKRGIIMNLLQDAYIGLFNGLFKHTGRINEKVRDIIVKICLVYLCFAYLIIIALTPHGITKVDDVSITSRGIVALIVLCIFSVKEPLKRIKWNKWIAYPYFLCAIYMSVTSFHHFTGKAYQAFAFQLLLIYPAIYFIYANRKDYAKYIDFISKVLIVMVLIVLIGDFIYEPPVEATCSGRYYGLAKGPNTFSVLMLMGTTATLYQMYLKSKWAIPGAIVMGMCLNSIWLSGARTATIAVALQLLTVTIAFFIKKDAQKARKRLMYFCAMILIVAIAFVGNAKVFAIIDEGSDKTGAVQMPTITTVAYADTGDEEEKNSTDRLFNIKGLTLEQISAGRIGIWKQYIAKMNLLGNDCTNHKVVEYSGQVVHNAHNTFLEIPYRFGVPAGIFYIVFTIAVFVMLFKAIFIKRTKPYAVFIALAAIAYWVEAMFDVMTLPFARGLVILFYISLVGVFEGDIITDKNSHSIENSESKVIEEIK